MVDGVPQFFQCAAKLAGWSVLERRKKLGSTDFAACDRGTERIIADTDFHVHDTVGKIVLSFTFLASSLTFVNSIKSPDVFAMHPGLA